MTIFTVGHSTRTIESFIGLLRAHEVQQVADIRTFPRSRRHPHFSRDALETGLANAGIAYRHFAALGGLRKPRRDSRNTAWRVEGFRGYADYMETPEFERALGELLDWAGYAPVVDPDQHHAVDDRTPRTVIMCAESVWWRCHRQLVADALVARAVEVRHIATEKSATAHTLTAFARLIDQRVSYPGLDSLAG